MVVTEFILTIMIGTYLFPPVDVVRYDYSGGWYCTVLYPLKPARIITVSTGTVLGKSTVPYSKYGGL